MRFPHLTTDVPVSLGLKCCNRTVRFLMVLTWVVVLSACSPDPSVAPPLPTSEDVVRRGQELVQGLGACGFCHSMERVPGAVLSGGVIFHDPYGEVQGPNITVSLQGIGSWSESQLKSFLRTSIRPDGSVAMSPLHRGIEWLSDADVARITAYLRSLPADEREVERREISFIDKNTTGFFDSKPAVRGYVSEIPSSFRAEYGRYLVDHVARCGTCHSCPGGVFASEIYLGGGQEVRVGEELSTIAPNISTSDMSGIGGWSENDIRAFFHSGKTPGGKIVDSRLCPVGFYANAPARDISAIIEYLRSVPAVE